MKNTAIVLTSLEFDTDYMKDEPVETTLLFDSMDKAIKELMNQELTAVDQKYISEDYMPDYRPAKDVLSILLQDMFEYQYEDYSVVVPLDTDILDYDLNASYDNKKLLHLNFTVELENSNKKRVYTIFTKNFN